MPAWAPERGSSTPTLSAAPWARTIAGAATKVLIAAAPASRRRRFTVTLRGSDMNTPLDRLNFADDRRGPQPHQASGSGPRDLSLSSVLEPLFDRCGNIEQAPVLAVAADQHQAGGKSVLPGQRQRDGTKVEEVDRIGVAQEQRVL